MLAARFVLSRYRMDSFTPSLLPGGALGRAGVSAHPDVRERALLFGVEELADHELLALLLATGTAGESAVSMATSLLETYGGIRGLALRGPHALLEVCGLGPAKATRVSAALELGRRSTLRRPIAEDFALTQFDSVVAWARPRLAGLEHEEVWLLALDPKNRLKSLRRVAQGGLHGCALTVKDVLRPALRDAASAILLVHNHPSGDPGPSPEDVSMTRALARACDQVGMPLLDHVIIAENGAYSLFDHGAFDV